MYSNFVDFFYPEVPGISEYGYRKPHIVWSTTIKTKNSFTELSQEVSLFCIHRVTDVFNDEWEIKADTFFIEKDGELYFLKEETTNYEQEVEINSNFQKFDFQKDEVSLCYNVKNERGFVNFVIPKAKWKKIQFVLEITKVPNGDEPEEIRQLFVGEKFSIELRSIIRYPAIRKKNCVLLSKQDVLNVLLRSGKIIPTNSFSNQIDYIAFSNGCYKMY